jgi:hypothetical protein
MASSGWVRWIPAMALGVVVVVAVAVNALFGDDTQPSTPTTTAPTGCGESGPTCDATPKVDGIYKVNKRGFLDVGITPGWIESPGPRPDANRCLWERLSGPQAGRIEFIIDTGNPTHGPVLVHVDKTDYAFWSQGCQPWERVSRD